MVMTLDRISADIDLVLACGLAVGPARLRLSDIESAGPAPIRVPTSRFGLLEVPDEQVIELVDGIIGFETCRRYVIVRNDEKSEFRWLQSLDAASVAFPILEPSSFRPDYAPTIGDADASLLELSANTPTLLFSIVTIPADNPRGMTANLLAPVVVNANTRRAKQVIVQDEGYTT